MISRKMIAKILCGHFEKCFLELEGFKNDVPALPLRNFLCLYYIIFMFYHYCELRVFEKAELLPSPRRLLLFQLFEKLTRTN